MALDAATLVRAGGGIALMAAGAVAFALARGAAARSGHIPLGLALVAYGAAFAVYNFTEALASTEAALVAEAPFFLLAAIGFVVFLVRGPWRVPSNERLLRGLLATASVLVALQVAIISAAEGTVLSFAGEAVIVTRALVVNNASAAGLRIALALVALVAAERALASGDPRRMRALAALALGIEAWAAYSVGLNLRPEVTINPVILVLARLAVSFSWLAVTRAPSGGRVAWIVSWGLLVMFLAGQVDPLAADSPFPGIVRAMGALLVIWALTTGALDNGARPARTVRRGTMAAGALAVLFIVAQVMQNILSAQYGLLMGGVVAGAFLFAASPIQRALESRRLPPRVEFHEAPRNPSRREAAYLDACRFAMRDRRLTREEEARLHRLADELGLTPSRAHELLVQAEAEAGAA